MEKILEEPSSTEQNSPRRKRSLKINMPWTTLTEEERNLGIYEDNADCEDLSDSDDDDSCYGDEEYYVGNHGNSVHFKDHSDIHKDKPKFQKLDLSSLTVPPLDFDMGATDLKLRDTDSLDVMISGVRGGKTSTPTNTEYSEISELREIEYDGKQSRMGMESREAVYQKAMDLLTVRCTSVQGSSVEPQDEPLICVNNPPFGINLPKYFYVQQNRPLPMPPLKAWRGYNGNVYFEPMQVNQVKRCVPERQTPDVERCSDKLKKILEPRVKGSDSSQHQSTQPSTRSEKTSKSRHSSDSGNESVTQMTVSISDKKAILNRLNQKLLREEEYQPEVKETVGSLKVDSNAAGMKQKSNKGKPTYQKDRICKGSVAHKVALQKKSQPYFSVNGGKFMAPTTMSPLLRTQTQYSQSSQRLATNSPDLFNSGAYEKFPPLDQLRASLRHMDNTPNKRMVVVPPNIAKGQNQKARPAYVKFSHDR